MKYSISTLKTAIKHPRKAARAIDRYYHKNILNGDYNLRGVNLLDQDWDNLISHCTRMRDRINSEVHSLIDVQQMDLPSEDIDYSLEYTIREGIIKFIDWYEENQEWYDPLVRKS